MTSEQANALAAASALWQVFAAFSRDFRWLENCVEEVRPGGQGPNSHQYFLAYRDLNGGEQKFAIRVEVEMSESGYPTANAVEIRRRE
jgi:hypothetical protein